MDRAVKTVFGKDADMWQLMQEGRLIPQDVFPEFAKEMAKVAREGGALDKQMGSVRSNVGRLTTTLKVMVDKSFSSGLDKAFNSVLKLMTSFVDILTMTVIPAISGFVGGFVSGFLMPLNAALGALRSFFKLLTTMINALGEFFGIDDLSTKILSFIGIIAGLRFAFGTLMLGLRLMTGMYANLTRVITGATAATAAFGRVSSAVTGAGMIFGAGSKVPKGFTPGRIAGIGAVGAAGIAGAEFLSTGGISGGTIGSLGGTALGAALGSFIPGIGTAIGAILGGTLGSVVGSSMNIDIKVDSSEDLKTSVRAAKDFGSFNVGISE